MNLQFHKYISVFIGLLTLNVLDASALPLSIEHLPHATVYSVLLDKPPQVIQLDRLQTIETVAKSTHALLVINAGFFDPINQLSSSFVMTQPGVWTSPEANPRLMMNETLAPYLPSILNRSELRIYRCNKQSVNAVNTMIARHQEAVSVQPGCTLVQAVGGGPQLLPQLTDHIEGFTDHNQQGQLIRDPVGVFKRNARTAIGLLPNHQLLLVLVAQKPSAPMNSGMSLPELAAYFAERGALQAMAFDGGSSSSLWVNGTMYWGKTNSKGLWVKRPVKSMLISY